MPSRATQAGSAPLLGELLGADDGAALGDDGAALGDDGAALGDDGAALGLRDGLAVGLAEGADVGCSVVGDVDGASVRATSTSITQPSGVSR